MVGVRPVETRVGMAILGGRLLRRKVLDRLNKSRRGFSAARKGKKSCSLQKEEGMYSVRECR